MKKLFPVLALMISAVSCSKHVLSDPDSILIGKKKQPHILLVGTFHFGYPNLDAHKTEKDKQVNILSSAKQEEVLELVNYISIFKPNKIVVEAPKNTGYLVNSFKRYKDGSEKLGANEISQIGFRLMERISNLTHYMDAMQHH